MNSGKAPMVLVPASYRYVEALLFCCSVVSFFFVFVEIARAARQTLVFRYDVAATGWSNALKTWSLDGETHW